MKLDPNKCARVMAERYFDISKLTEATGLTFKTVSQTVRGLTTPRANNLKKICDALQCEARDLLPD